MAYWWRRSTLDDDAPTPGSARHRRAVDATSSPNLDPRRFEGAFKQVPDDVNQFLKAGNDTFAQELNSQPNTKLDTAMRVKTNLVDQRPSSYQDCVAWARLEFQQCFHDSIAQLLHNFPADQVTASGAPFWSGADAASSLNFNVTSL